MKKVLIGLFAMTGLLFASCNMDVKDSTAKESYAAFNLINPLDGGTPDASASIYTVDMNVTKLTSTMSGLIYYNKSKFEFLSNDIPVIQEIGANLFKGFEGNVNNDPTLPLANTNILVTYNFNYPYGQFYDPDNKNNAFTLNTFYPNKENVAQGGTAIDGVLYKPGNSVYAPVVVGSYQMGHDYKVTMFTTDRTYSGITGTTYSMMGQPASATSKTIYYRVILDIKENTACVVMYKAKFSNVESEPEKPVIYIPGLKLTWGDASYTVSGTDIIPMVIEAGKLEEMPDFKFARFNMASAGQFMTDATMSFTVINSFKGQNIEYKGNFQGTSVVIPDKMKM